jgi:hypothetical protein
VVGMVETVVQDQERRGHCREDVGQDDEAQVRAMASRFLAPETRAYARRMQDSACAHGGGPASGSIPDGMHAGS